MARLINAEKMGFFATPPRVTALITQWLQAPQGENLCRLLDPCCGEGVALAQIAEALSGKCETWGVELSPARAAAAGERLDRVYNTAWQFTRAGRESVSLLYLNPPYDHDLDGTDGRLEIEFLRTTLNTLVYDGLLVYVVPQHLLGHPEAARLLAGHFTALVVRRFPDGEYERFKQVVVFGRRQRYTTPTQEALDTLLALEPI
jgi:SAM-dependent methyltransferase